MFRNTELPKPYNTSSGFLGSIIHGIDIHSHPRQRVFVSGTCVKHEGTTTIDTLLECGNCNTTERIVGACQDCIGDDVEKRRKQVEDNDRLKTKLMKKIPETIEISLEGFLDEELTKLFPNCKSTIKPLEVLTEKNGWIISLSRCRHCEGHLYASYPDTSCCGGNDTIDLLTCEQ